MLAAVWDQTARQPRLVASEHLWFVRPAMFAPSQGELPEAAINQQCSICMDELQAGEEVVTLPCRHGLHKTCVDEYAANLGVAVDALACPQCRSNIGDAALAALLEPAPVVDLIEEVDADVEAADAATDDALRALMGNAGGTEAVDTQPAPAAKAKAKAKAKACSPRRSVLRLLVPESGASAALSAMPAEVGALPALGASHVNEGASRTRSQAKGKAKGKAKGTAKGKAKRTSTPTTQPAPAEEPAPETPGASTRNPALDAAADTKVWCSWCGSHLPIMRCRAKSSNKFQCKVCATKCTQLSRVCGSWPVTDFKELPDDQQKSFFKSIAGKGMSGIKGIVEDLLQRIEKKEDTFCEGGKFLPLSVWERKGFNITDIETKTLPKDISEHAVLGATYRLRLVSLTTAQTTATERIKRLRVSRAPQGFSVGQSLGGSGSAFPSADAAALHNGSGASGSGGAAALGTEEGMAEMRAVVQAQRQEMQNKIRVAANLKKVAGANSTKLHTLVEKFEQAVHDPRFSVVPRGVAATMKAVLEGAVAFKATCDGIVASGADEDHDAPSLRAVSFLWCTM